MEQVCTSKTFGSSYVHPYSFNHHSFFLKDILHCLQASANLLSINKFGIDKNYWFALIGSHLFVMDNQMGHVLLQGPSENGFYPIPFYFFDRVIFFYLNERKRLPRKIFHLMILFHFKPKHKEIVINAITNFKMVVK
jgi:hypothetical protein